MVRADSGGNPDAYEAGTHHARPHPLAAPPEWPGWVENDAAELLRTIDTLEAGVEDLRHRFHAFFEPGKPPFPMTFAGWQELKRDIAMRLEAVGWHLTPEGLHKSQSKST